jgi:hypothetical protein
VIPLAAAILAAMLDQLTSLEGVAAASMTVWLVVVAVRYLTPHISVEYNQSSQRIARMVDVSELATLSHVLLTHFNQACAPIHNYSPLPFHLIDIFGFFATTVPFFLRKTSYHPS